MASRNLSSVTRERRGEEACWATHVFKLLHGRGKKKKRFSPQRFGGRKRHDFFSFWIEWVLRRFHPVFSIDLCVHLVVWQTQRIYLVLGHRTSGWLTRWLVAPPPPPPPPRLRQGSPCWLQREADAASQQADPESKMEQKWFSCQSLVFWIHVGKKCGTLRWSGPVLHGLQRRRGQGGDPVERCSIKALARILRILLFFYCWLVRSNISFSPDPMSNHMHLHPAFGSHLVVGNFSTVLLTLSLPSWSVADSFFFLHQCWSFLYNAILRSQADSLHSRHMWFWISCIWSTTECDEIPWLL